MKKKIFNGLLIISVFLLLGTISFADSSSAAFREIFQQAKTAPGNNVIATIVDAMYFGLITIFRGVSQRIVLVVAGFMVMLLSADSIRTIFTSLGRIDYISMMKKLIPNLIKGIMTLAFLTMPMTYNASLNKGQQVKGSMFTWLVEKMFAIFYKLGLRFFGDSRFTNLTPGQMADVFFSSPLTLLQNSFSTWTLLAVFTNILKILVLVLCIWMAGKIVATLISNMFSALMLCTFSVFFLQFLLFEPTKSMAQRGINTIVAQIVSVFMTVGMVGLSYQTMKLIATDNSMSGIITLAILLMMMQQCTENIASMAMAMVNGSGLGHSNSAGFMSLLSSAGAIIGGGLMFATEGAENMIGDFKNGMEGSTEQGMGKIFDGAKNMAKNSAAADIFGDAKLAASQKFSRSKTIKALMDKGQDLKTAMANTKAIENAQKAYRNKQKALRELERKQRGMGAGSVAGIGANVLISALSGNLHDTKILGSIASRIGGQNVSQEKLLEAKRDLLDAGSKVKAFEQVTGFTVPGGHNNADFEKLSQELATNGYKNEVREFWNLMEEARSGNIDMASEKFKTIYNSLERMANEAPNTAAGDQIREGMRGFANFVEGQNLAAAITDPTSQTGNEGLKSGNGGSEAGGTYGTGGANNSQKRVNDEFVNKQVNPTVIKETGIKTDTGTKNNINQNTDDINTFKNKNNINDNNEEV